MPETQPSLQRTYDGALAEFTWPGAYPLFYIMRNGDVVCPMCARHAEADGDLPRAAEANWENPALYCDACSKRIESAYAEPDDA